MEEILHQAEQLEREYDWLGAAESRRKTLNLLPEDDFSRKGDITERFGYAFYRAAFQVENNDEFRERMRQSVANYQKAKEFYAKMVGAEIIGIDDRSLKGLKSIKLCTQVFGGISGSRVEISDFYSLTDYENLCARVMKDEEMKRIHAEFMALKDLTTYRIEVLNAN